MTDPISPDAPKYSWAWRFINLQPAVYRGLIIAVVTILAAVGIKVSEDVPDIAFMLVLAILPVVQGVWTKGAVTPNAKVAVRVDDPIHAPEVVTAGEAAVPNATSDEAILEAAAERGV